MNSPINYDAATLLFEKIQHLISLAESGENSNFNDLKENSDYLYEVFIETFRQLKNFHPLKPQFVEAIIPIVDHFIIFSEIKYDEYTFKIQKYLNDMIVYLKNLLAQVVESLKCGMNN